MEQTGDSDLTELQDQLRVREIMIKKLNTKNNDLSQRHDTLQINYNRSVNINILLAIISIISWLIFVGLMMRNAKKKKRLKS